MSDKSKIKPIFTKEKADLLKRTLGKFDENITVDPLTLEDSITNASSLKDSTFLLHILIEILCLILEDDEYKRKELFNRLYKGFEENKLIHSVINVDNLVRTRREAALQFYEHIKQVHKNLSPLLNEPVYELPSIHISRIEKYNEAFDELSIIAKGGFGTVCMARHKVDSAIYAVKKIIFVYRKDSDYVKVMREVRSLSSLSNKYVVAYNNAWVQPVPPDMRCEELDSESDYTEDQSTSTDTFDEPVNNSVSFQVHSNKADRVSRNTESSGVIFQDDTNESQSSISTKSDFKSKRISDSSTDSIIFSNDARSSLNEKYDLESKRASCSGDSSNIFQNPFESQSSFSSEYDSKSKSVPNGSKHKGIAFQNDPNEFLSNLPTHQSDSSSPLKNKESGALVPHFSMLQIKMMLCIQMEYCDCDLRHWLEARNEGHPLPFIKSIPDIFKEILSGVAYIHEKKLIHRDLKPQNIFFSKEKGVMKVGDLGLATLSRTPAEDAQSSSKHSTNLGTMPYAAPEQRSNSVYDSKVDMYSLGIILIELLVKIGTKMELFRVIKDFKLGIIPEEIQQGWPDYIPLLKNLLQENNTYRMTAQQVLDMPLFKEKKIEESDWEQKSNDLEIKLANKEIELQKLKETLALKEETLAQKLQNQELAFQKRLEEQKWAMEQKFQKEKREMEEVLTSNEHMFQKISEEVKLLNDYLNTLQ